MHLPNSPKLNIGSLSKLFSNTSECYKLFWFQTIMTKLDEGKTRFTFDEIVNEMIADAWYMVTEYHLNLGPRDNLEYLQRCKTNVPGIVDRVHDAFDKCAKKHLNTDVEFRLFAKDISEPEFAGMLKDLMYPAYEAAKTSGFITWIYDDKRKVSS